VVAEEVRRLAQRSNAAASEIDQLIDSSQRQVNQGTKVVNQVGEDLKGIVNQVREISMGMRGLNNSMDQQERGIEEINRMSQDLAESTEKNLSFVRELQQVVDCSLAGTKTLDRASARLDKIIADLEVHKVEAVPDLIQWGPGFSVKVAELDNQHQVLVKLINLINAYNRQGKKVSEYDDILESLVNYTVAHFSYEEEMMRKANYRNFRGHKPMHEEFLQAVADFLGEFKAGRATVEQLLEILKSWLVNHIQKSDMEYADALNAAGIT